MSQNKFSYYGDFLSISSEILESFAAMSFNDDIVLAYMVKKDKFCCMTLSFDLTKQDHREIAFSSMVSHAYKNESDSVALAIPCWYDKNKMSLSLTKKVNDNNYQGMPVFVSLHVNSLMEIVEGGYFQVFEGSFDSSVFPFSKIPNETVKELKAQLGIKPLTENDYRLNNSKISLEPPIWSKLFDREETIH